MTHELARQLEDADYLKKNPLHGETIDRMPNPTLSELINACGDKFGGILYNPPSGTNVEGTWKVFESFWLILKEPSRSFGSWLKGKVVHGTTPEEAVAKLWLELNKND